MSELKLLGVRREPIGPARWQVDISLPDDDPMLVGAGIGTSNMPGDPHNRLVFFARTAEQLDRLSELLADAAARARES